MAVGEWDNRQLCPDGGCVGVIGPEGTCKVCGRAALNWGDERNRGLNVPPDDETDETDDDDDDDDDDELAADADEDDDDEDDDDDDDGDDDGEDDEDDDDDDDDGEGDDKAQAAPRELTASPGWSSRRLCPDGACIGVIGADGRCKVCGRTAKAAAASASSIDPTGDEPAGASAGDAEPAAPRPCADSACAGVIGPDDHCTVCGKVVA